MAVEPESWLRMYPEFAVTADQKKAWIADRQGALVGVDTMKRFGWKVGERIPLQATIFRRRDGSAWEFNISGVYDSPVKGTDKTQLFFHYDYLNEVVRSTGFSDQVGWLVVRVDDPAQAPDVAKKIDTLFANSQTETKTDSEKNFVAGWAKQIGNISLITQLIAAAAIFMMLLVTANTMAQSIRERTSELAVLKTLGFGDGRVLSMVLMESCILALVGGLAGLAVSYTLVTLGGDPTGSFLPQFYFPVTDVLIGVLMVVLLGFAAGAVPALQAQRLRIVDALRRT
jgi:putative ABC transport system permease protein